MKAPGELVGLSAGGLSEFPASELAAFPAAALSAPSIAFEAGSAAVLAPMAFESLLATPTLPNVFSRIPRALSLSKSPASSSTIRSGR